MGSPARAPQWLDSDADEEQEQAEGPVQTDRAGQEVRDGGLICKRLIHWPHAT